MIAAWLLGGLLVVLVAIHMARPRFKEITLSAARFFSHLPPARPNQWRLRWGNPFRSRPLYLQLPLLLLLLIAVLSIEGTFGIGESKGIGIWLVVDSSASMSTSQNGTTRMALAQEASYEAIIEAESASEGLEFCLNLSTFDLDLQDLLVKQDANVARGLIEKLAPRPLGTDLNLIRRLLENQSDGEDRDVSSDSECPITHLVVVSDLPAPEWIADHDLGGVIWRDVGLAVDNIGLTDIQASRNPLTGLVHEVSVEVTAFGVPPANSRLVVSAPDGSELLSEGLDYGAGDLKWRKSFSLAGAGQYTLQLSPGGAYRYDDEAVIEISDGETIRVDWQLSDRGLVEQLGWVEEQRQPHLRVVGYQTELDSVPTLVVGNGYPAQPSALIEIRDFYEASPLLADLNFDVAESLGIQGVELPPDFRAVLRGLDESVWLAQRETPPAAYVPGLPTAGDDNLGHFSTTAFFNALRWLLQEHPLPPLYTLTTPAKPEPTGNHLALHEDEGNTMREPYSYGSLADLQPVSTGGEKMPIWPILLTLAVLLFLIERGLAAFGNEKWR